MWTYNALHTLLDEPDREVLRQQVSEEAFSMRDVGTALELLLATGHHARAQELLLARFDELRRSTVSLERLAPQALEKGYPLIAMMLWRVALDSILDRGAYKVYDQAATYLRELRKLTEVVDDYGGLPHHWDYEKDLRWRHDRKTSFWPRV